MNKQRTAAHPADRPLQIGIDASRLAVGQRTGTEHYSWNLLAALGLRPGNHHYTLYANRRPQSLPPLPPRFALRTIPWPRLWTHLRLSFDLLHHRPDVLFVPAHVVPLVHPCPTVVTIHDLGYIHYPTAHPPAQRLYLRLSTYWSAVQATHVIVDSVATRDDLLRYCRVPEHKISVVHLGTGPQFRPLPGDGRLVELRQRLKLPRRYLLFLGTLQPRKNIVRLIEAFARAGLPELDLVVAGKRGWLVDQITGQAERLGVGDRVHFLGYVADDDIPGLINAAHGFVLPSLYEGFGLPAVEAMACGTPVLVSRVASLPEVVGDAAILVDPLQVDDIARGLHELAMDDSLRVQLRQRGLERAARFTWQRCGDQTLAILERAAAAR
ncbi:MAG: glycosyltransferase family 1 protein [Herpetosiphon sp.]